MQKMNIIMDRKYTLVPANQQPRLEEQVVHGGHALH